MTIYIDNHPYLYEQKLAYQYQLPANVPVPIPKIKPNPYYKMRMDSETGLPTFIQSATYSYPHMAVDVRFYNGKQMWLPRETIEHVPGFEGSLSLVSEFHLLELVENFYEARADYREQINEFVG